MDFSEGDVWDPKLDVILNDIIGAKEKDVVACIRTNWINVGFMNFVFKYAGSISHTRKGLIDAIKNGPEPSNFFDIVSGSNIAWAVTIYVNNILFWPYVIALDAAKKKKLMAIPTPPNHRKRKRQKERKHRKPQQPYSP